MVTNAYLTSFNSTLVQLKELLPESTEEELKCFNSTLVQLKEIKRCCSGCFD